MGSLRERFLISMRKRASDTRVCHLPSDTVHARTTRKAMKKSDVFESHVLNEPKGGAKKLAKKGMIERRSMTPNQEVANAHVLRQPPLVMRRFSAFCVRTVVCRTIY